MVFLGVLLCVDLCNVSNNRCLCVSLKSVGLIQKATFRKKSGLFSLVTPAFAQPAAIYKILPPAGAM